MGLTDSTDLTLYRKLLKMLDQDLGVESECYVSAARDCAHNSNSWPLLDLTPITDGEKCSSMPVNGKG
jgi:hypothetical protein